MSKVKSFFQESKQEFNRINWPTGRETFRLIVIVFAISIVLGVFLGAVDYGFLKLVEYVRTL